MGNTDTMTLDLQTDLQIYYRWRLYSVAVCSETPGG